VVSHSADGASDMDSVAHHLLVVEDDPGTSRHLLALARSLGMTARLAATLAEVEAALAEEKYCCVLLDKQLPAVAGATPYAITGDAAQKRVRAVDPRRNESDFHVLPILVITAAAAELEEGRKAEFISKNFRDGASAYIPKPFDLEAVGREILAALERAERADHSCCTALAPKAVRPSKKPPVTKALAAELGASSWSDLTLVAVDGHTLRIQAGSKTVRRTYVDLGFASGATREPIDKWRIVLETCAGRGVFRGNPRGKMEAARNAVYVTQKMLRKVFGLGDNPYKAYKEDVGWVAKFRASSELGDDD
jgi:CheY-like chemotaxis protein